MTTKVPSKDNRTVTTAGATPPPSKMTFQPSSVSFGRHESFPLRFGWIDKGLDALRSDPGVFLREDATVVLGVGRNMVASIRYWLQVASLVEQEAGGRGLVETELARIAFGENGDPYLEDDESIWLLHWLLATNPVGATAVYWFFNHFHKQAFTGEEAAGSLRSFADREVVTKVSATTLNRDATTVLRMYTRTTPGTRLSLEDALDSPLSLLNLVNRVDTQHRRSQAALRSDLPLPVFAFAIAQVFDHLEVTHAAIQDLMYSDLARCAPGAVFRMTEEGLVRKLDQLCASAPSDFRLDHTAGVDQLYRLRTVSPLDILSNGIGHGQRAAA